MTAMTAVSAADGPVLVRSVPKLSPRQTEILVLLASGRSRSEVAGRLGIGTSAVDKHVEAAYRNAGTGGLIETFAKLRWLDTTAPRSELAAATLADLEARLAAIHADSGALLAELRGAA